MSDDGRTIVDAPVSTTIGTVTRSQPATVIDPHSTPLARLASDHVLEAAHAWLCHRRRDYPADADVWAFRRYWLLEKKRLRAANNISSSRT